MRETILEKRWVGVRIVVEGQEVRDAKKSRPHTTGHRLRPCLISSSKSRDGGNIHVSSTLLIQGIQKGKSIVNPLDCHMINRTVINTLITTNNGITD